MSLGLDPNFWYYNGEAYDLTPFVNSHPGGKWAILLAKGHECETLFNSYHLDPLGKPLEVLKKYRLPDDKQKGLTKFSGAQKYTFARNGFYDTVKKEALKYFQDNKLSHKAGWLHWLMVYINIFGMFGTMFGMCSPSLSFPLLLACTIIHGFFRAILTVQTVHAASHFSLSHSPAANRWFYRLGTVLIGLWAPPVWDIQHVVAHHVYTNEWPFDTDSAFPIKSIHKNQRRLFYHRFQHIYTWFVYAFTIPLVMLNSVRVVLTKKQMLFKLTFDVPGSYYEGIFCSLFSIIYMILPFFFLDFRTALLLMLINNVVSSLTFSLQFVVNHEISEVVYNHPADNTYDWGVFECLTSANYSVDSQFWLEVSGGLNTQIEHHLFPSIHYSHYRNLSKIVRKVLKEKFPEVTYFTKDNLYESLRSHYQLLQNPPESDRSGKKIIKIK